ncbi:PIH1 domain-containing protein 2 [Hydra vulgaris]|uniref:PIH1 domain-containing protein 2 n=1 Tax=Hydra vulgaris TaxID=6087 RepID=A0ABM4B366_HYDVU
MGEPNVLDDASSIWKFLDNMYVSNPVAYKKFIDGVLNEGKEQNMGPPKAHLAIQTVRIPPVIPSRKYFINVAKWTQVPQPENTCSPIPMIISEQRKELIDEEWANLIDIAVNPILFEKNGLFYTDVSEILQASLLYAESKFSLKLSKNYTILNVKYIGNEDNLLNFMCPTLRDSIKKAGSILDQDKIRQSNQETINKPNLDSSISTTNNTNNSFALKEISSKVSSQTCSKKNFLQTPKAEMDVNKISKQICFTIELPGVGSVSECILELTEDELLLVVTEKYELHLDLPLSIDVNTSKAKFIKDEQILLITAPFLIK